MTPAPRRAPHDTEREVRLPATLGAALAGRPAGHREHVATYDAVFGEIPADREDLWRAYLNCYMNCQVDVDAQIQRVLDALTAAGHGEDTIVVFVADHGELGGAHGLRQKGPFIHRENTNVPLVIAHPDHPGGQVVPALMSAADLAPTLCAFAGLSEAAPKAEFPGVVGHSYADLLATPDAPGPRAEKGILFTYDGLSTVDSTFAIANASPFGNSPGSDCANGALDLDKRGFVRAVCDGEHRLARWFSPRGFNTPADVEALRRDNDVELLRAGHGADSDTPLDVDAAENTAVVEAMRAKLEALIAAEIGADGYVIPPIEFC
jgi:arylsulfatase